MTAPIIITVLAFLHIASAMGWLGGAVLFVSSIAPGLRTLSPTASLEFLAKIGPRSTRFFAGASTSTIVFGLALFFLGPELNASTIYIGIGLGLIAYLTAIVTLVSFRKADHIAKQKLESGQQGPPPEEMMKALRTGGITVVITALLLVGALFFMVATGFPF